MTNGEEIAIIGIDCRFPHANTLQEFWENLVKGKECITFLTEIERAGIENKNLVNNPKYVPCKGGVLQLVDHFDAPFFGYSPREARLMDPQIRIFHECTWSALENAGYPPTLFKGDIGLYACASDNLPWKNNILFSQENQLRDGFALSHLINKDFIGSRVAYNLNLTGPCFTMQTACSTSLVAVHLACQGILNGECDLAVAGGVSIHYGMEDGYLYHEGAILSPDGHCRPFDARAQGTIPGSGAGVVVLKLLEKALRDGDSIHAVIKGSAINNDGKQKAGYSSPSIEGQAKVIRAALKVAEAHPATVCYVEAHGTATPLGDPVEIEALKIAFTGADKQGCAIGSLKSNVGHMDVAAGIGGLIKSVLILKNRQIPPTLHFTEVNPKIDLKNTPFYVVGQLKDLSCKPELLRVSVSSFGIGGTNAHLVLEEYAGQEKVITSTSCHHLILLSARTDSALEKAKQKLLPYLRSDASIELHDVAYTLAVGREHFAKRQVFVAKHANVLAEQLDVNDLERPSKDKLLDKVLSNNIIFMFPGQGSQYENMVSEIYHNEPLFRVHLDKCFNHYKKETGKDIKELIFVPSSVASDGSLHQTQNAQVSLFIIEYALACTLMSLGVKPDGAIGHSIGEYVAACLAGVFTFEEGLQIVIKRGELMQGMMPGSMMSVNIDQSEISHYASKYEVSLAAVNLWGHYTFSGETGKINRLEMELIEMGYQPKRLLTSHAFHSGMMDPMLVEFGMYLDTFNFQPARFPYSSNLTGETVAIGQVVKSKYWVEHLRQTVQFAKGIDGMLSQYPEGIFIELGPGNSLSAIVRRSKRFGKSHRLFNLVKHKLDQESDHVHFLKALGGVWIEGVNLDFGHLYREKPGHRLHMPTYAFDPHIYNASVEFNSPETILTQYGKRSDSISSGLFYAPNWEQQAVNSKSLDSSECPLLVFLPNAWSPEQFAKAFKIHYQKVIFVLVGEVFKKINDFEFTIPLGDKESYYQLIKHLKENKLFFGKVMHAWTLQDDSTPLSWSRTELYSELGFYSLIYLVQSIGAAGLTQAVEIEVVTNGSLDVLGGECTHPEKNMLQGICKIIPLEYTTIKCRYTDVETQFLSEPNVLLQRLAEHLTSPMVQSSCALRGKRTWVENYRLVQLSEPAVKTNPFRQKGKYLITGGLGGMALFIAKYLVQNYEATVVLVSRSQPGQLMHSSDTQDQKKLSLVEDIKQANGLILFRQADVGDEELMKEIVKDCEDAYGKFNGLLHTAAVIDNFGAIQRRTRKDFQVSMHAKVRGTLVLHELFSEHELDFAVFFSSAGTVNYQNKYGEAGYVAANCYLDALASGAFGKHGTPVKTINWCDWSQVGLSIRAIDTFFGADEVAKQAALSEFENEALSPEEGVNAFVQIMSNPLSRVILSKAQLKDLNYVKPDGWEKKQKLFLNQAKAPLHREAGKEYHATEPADEIQRCILGIWQDYFGYQGISIHDNIFDMGASSLDVAQINESLKTKLHIDIPLVTQYEYPTIDKLAQFIRGDEVQELKQDTDARVISAKSKMNQLRALSKNK